METQGSKEMFAGQTLGANGRPRLGCHWTLSSEEASKLLGGVSGLFNHLIVHPQTPAFASARREFVYALRFAPAINRIVKESLRL